MLEETKPQNGACRLGLLTRFDITRKSAFSMPTPLATPPAPKFSLNSEACLCVQMMLQD